MIELSNLRVSLDAALPENKQQLIRTVARALRVKPSDVGGLTLLKRSVDARKKSDVHFVATYGVELSDAVQAHVLASGVAAPLHVKLHVPYEGYAAPSVKAGEGTAEAHASKTVVVVGSGPAGLFAAWVLSAAGVPCVLLERGECVDDRMKSVDAFNGGAALNPESNIQFGEGGAGTFSDGKLTTNIKNPRCKDVLHIFAQAGAPEEILWQAKPHIGTDKLVGIVRTMRQQIIAAGGQVRFGARVDGVAFDGSTVRGVHVTDVATGEASFVEAGRVVLATGHSARDVFGWVKESGLTMERKPFSVGVRIEHLQDAVNASQYGAAAQHPALGAADYKMAVHLPGGRGVYTFCMCPGGTVVCAASEEGGVVVNGMSTFARDGENANSAVLVGVDDADLPGDDVLAGVELQRQMERAAFEAAGKTYAAPAMRVGDFLAAAHGGVAAGDGAVTGQGASACADTQVGPAPTYARGVAWCNLHNVLPDFVATSLAEALPLMDRKLHGFAASNAVMTGVETRSSSPVRIVRSKETMQASFADGTPCAVYPCGEGAGYAGGIMSAAVDGLRVAEAILAQMGNEA